MISVTVGFTEEQMRRLKQRAAAEKVSVSEVVRRSVERSFRDEREPSLEEKWRRATAVVGKFRFGPKDLATRHDDYFVEALEASHRKR